MVAVHIFETCSIVRFIQWYMPCWLSVEDALWCIFMEMDLRVVFDVLRPNLEWTGFFDNLVTHPVCVETYLECTKGDPFNYTSVIPPYMLVDYEILIICYWRLFFYSCGVSIPNRYAENMFVPHEVI